MVPQILCRHEEASFGSRDGRFLGCDCPVCKPKQEPSTATSLEEKAPNTNLTGLGKCLLLFCFCSLKGGCKNKTGSFATMRSGLTQFLDFVLFGEDHFRGERKVVAPFQMPFCPYQNWNQCRKGVPFLKRVSVMPPTSAKWWHGRHSADIDDIARDVNMLSNRRLSRNGNSSRAWLLPKEGKKNGKRPGKT